MVIEKLKTLEGNGGEVFVVLGCVRPDFGGGKAAITIARDEVGDDERDLVC